MKRIAYFVIGFHCLLLLWMIIWMPTKPIEKKPLKVRTVVKAPPPPPAPAPTPPAPVVQVVKAPPAPPKKAPPPRKQAPQKRPVAKKPAAPPAVPQNLVNQLKQSIAKIDENPQKVLTNRALKAPSAIATLKVDQMAEEVEDGYVSSLVDCLQSALDLPEVGEVKLELTLTSGGRFVRIKVVKSGSDRNRLFLESALKSIPFPPFSGQLKQHQEHTFVLSFHNS